MTTQTIGRPVQRPAADLEALFPGRYLSVTLTDLHSAKVRRVRHDPHVLVAPCRVNGKLRGEPVPARVEVLTATADLERVQQLLKDRHKISYRLVMLGYRIGRRLRGRQSVADGAALAITVQ